MGNVGSRPEEATALYLRDQTRFSIASLRVTNAQKQILYTISPHGFPASRLVAKRETDEEVPLDFVLDPESANTNAPPSFLFRLNNDEAINFEFAFVLRQPRTSNPVNGISSGSVTPNAGGMETNINGLTYVFASNSREIENLVTREFRADPNLHKNSSVQLVGDFATDGRPSVQFDWSWRWTPPKAQEDKGGGWRNSCSFVEYDQRAHRLNTLATFSFWVQNAPRRPQSPRLPSPTLGMLSPPRIRLASSQSMDSRISGVDGRDEYLEPPSPIEAIPELHMLIAPTAAPTAVKVDVTCHRPGEDMSAVEDGPLFRATMKALEQKTGSMRMRMKKVLKKAEAAQQAQVDCNEAVTAFMEALKEAALSNANAIQPALEHYFEKIAQEILRYEKQNTANLQKMLIEPLTRLYNLDIKQAEAKKRDFEDESREYYAYLGRYLGQRQDSLKDKKRAESDSKYQSKRKIFELSRFDYSSFMQDLHGGRKDQEVLSYLTKFADAQASAYLTTAKKVEELIPQLDALNHEVKEAEKEFQYQRTEREEKRRTLEMSTNTYVEPESVSSSLGTSVGSSGANGYMPESDLGRSNSSGGSTVRPTTSNQPSIVPSNGSTLSSGSTPGINERSMSAGNQLGSSPGFNKMFGDARDNPDTLGVDKPSMQVRKEGLLWALSRPGSLADPKGLNKQAWHKFWIVLDQGRLSEYSNWKQKLDLHMDPIDLRMASVREARNAERRFCFEIITPQFKRVYQATSEDDMNNWISAINNALQSAVEGRGIQPSFPPPSPVDNYLRRDISSVFTGKSSSHHGYYGGHHHSKISSPSVGSVYRRITVGARPSYIRTESNSFEENPDKLLQIVRNTDQGNCWCADCGSGIKTEWVSINLGIVLCIECSGIHRSLGTHISKVRSLTLDTTSFTTDIVELLLQVGNRVSNMIWEARLDRTQKPTSNSTREQRLQFITAKYVKKEFVTPITSMLSHYSTPEETLLASIKKNDLQGVLYAIALGANTNATDRSRNTHAVHLALAAADPATPASSSTASPMISTSLPPKPIEPSKASSSAVKAVPFPIAELLVQNGAEVPSTPPAFPLGRSAQLFLEQRAGRNRDLAAAMAIRARAGGATVGANDGDTLGALPVIGGRPDSSGVGQQGPGLTHSISAHEKSREKEATRLQKRLSAGGRLARSVGP